MYPLHPLAVHAPIGLLLGSALLTALYLWRGDRGVEVAAYHTLWLGWLCALPAVLSGTYEAVRQLTADAPRTDALFWINGHAAAALAALGAYWCAWQLRRRDPAILDKPAQRNRYLFWQAAGLLLLVLTGWLGGHLVYALRVGLR